jgi:DNA-binding transcriptional MocR family regulator
MPSARPGRLPGHDRAPEDLREGRPLHRVGHPRDEPLGRGRRRSARPGFPDFACPPELKRAVAEAVDADINQYAITWGSKPLRDAIAATTPRHFPGWPDIDPETQVTVTCGATEAMIAAMLGLLDPGDEVIVFEPFYENYGPDAILSDAVPRYVTPMSPTGPSIPTSCAPPSVRGPGARRQLAAQPDGQGLHPR